MLSTPLPTYPLHLLLVPNRALGRADAIDRGTGGTRGKARPLSAAPAATASAAAAGAPIRPDREPLLRS